MFKCYLCSKLFQSIDSLSIHLKLHKNAGHNVEPATCLFDKCNKYQFSSIKLFIRHLNTTHFNQSEFYKDNESFSSNSRYTSDDCIYLGNKEDFEKSSNFKNELNEDIYYILYLKSKVNCCDSLLNDIIGKFSKLNGIILDFIFDLIVLKDQTIDKESIKKLISKICLKNYQTSYKQLKIIRENEHFVESKTVNLGQRVETVSKEGTLKMVFKKESFEYISILDSLRSLLHNKAIQDCIKEEKREVAFNPWHINYSNNGDSAGVYKLGMFFFTLINLTRKNISNLKKIFLLTSCFSEDIKKYHMNVILRKIVDDIKILEIDGITINNETFYGSVLQVCADNLGLHQIFNLKCNFLGENICHLCDASSEKIQYLFNESCFERISYSKLLKAINHEK
ncbi:unnamed protein product [Brachionus calyciflorus]|uniref:C2H2-type domain-containing protein n=1 Tax=Brachionus calyciflorus TaxID=104777 RepID=A0A814BEQ0_9BILA|nr:unnamed protein product [Brachionus calyciflorus]